MFSGAEPPDSEQDAMAAAPRGRSSAKAANATPEQRRATGRAGLKEGVVQRSFDRPAVEAALHQLSVLMETGSPEEGEFQDWFGRHPVVFAAYGYQRWISHPELVTHAGETYWPDFVVQRLTGVWDVFEIKRPDTKVLRHAARRQEFYAEFRAYVKQCRDYARYFLLPQHRAAYTQRYGATVQEEWRSILVAGRSADLDPLRVNDILADEGATVEHQSYDDVRRRLEFLRVQAFAKYENNVGRSLHFMIIPRRLEGRPSYVMDIGSHADRNRISLYFDERQRLVLRVVDGDREAHIVRMAMGDERLLYDRLAYIVCEVGVGAGHAFLSIEIDGQHFADARLPGFDFDPEGGLPYVLGADVTGTAHSAMDVAEILVYDRTLTFWERVDLRNYVASKYAPDVESPEAAPMRLRFRGNQFLHSVGHPNFVNAPGPGANEDEAPDRRHR